MPSGLVHGREHRVNAAVHCSSPLVYLPHYAGGVDPWWWTALAGVVLGGAGGYLATRRWRAVEPGPPVAARELADALPTPLLIAFSDGRVWHANPAGRSAGVTTGAGLLVDDLRELVVAAQRTGQQVEMDLSSRAAPGKAAAAHVTATPVTGELSVVALYDTGSALAMEAARRDFAVNVSHELKTPIGALSLLVEAMTAAADDKHAVREFVRRMSHEVARLSSLVQQIIHLSRVQSADTVVRPVSVRLVPWLESVVSDLGTLAEDRQVALTTEAADVELWADPELLAMAVRNVIDNAIQYSRAGAKVVVTARPEGDDVVITVVDNGMGIRDEDLPRIFERFYRADDARSRDSGGTGLGLSIVKHVVRQHGSDVQVWSAVGVGTTVTMRIPGKDTRS